MVSATAPASHLQGVLLGVRDGSSLWRVLHEAFGFLRGLPSVSRGGFRLFVGQVFAGNVSAVGGVSHTTSLLRGSFEPPPDLLLEA